MAKGSVSKKKIEQKVAQSAESENEKSVIQEERSLKNEESFQRRPIGIKKELCIGIRRPFVHEQEDILKGRLHLQVQNGRRKNCFDLFDSNSGKFIGTITRMRMEYAWEKAQNALNAGTLFAE